MFLIHLFARLQTWLERRQALADLYSFSDHDLHDIGLTRGEIEAAVDGRFTR